MIIMRDLVDKFVVGFAFSKNTDSILLVKKLRPEWQKGLLNGIEGKIKNDEIPIDAMSRECREETGLLLDWRCRGIMQGINNDGEYFTCYIFYSYSQNILNYKQVEDELLGVYNPLYIDPTQVVSNLNFLILFGRSVCNDQRDVFITLDY